MYVCVYIYIYICIEREREREREILPKTRNDELLRDKDLYTTTNKCLQCLIKLMYTVF